MRFAYSECVAGRPIHRWSIGQPEPFVHVETDQADVGLWLMHVLGTRAIVTASSCTVQARGTWTIRALATTDYAAHLATFTACPDGPPPPGLADYWRSDFIGRQLGRNGTLLVVHHAVPFEGLTLFETETATITHLVPSGAPIFLPHLDHLVAHALRFRGWQRGYVDMHAAFVRYRGKGLALSGPRLAGKTSLAMHLLARGAQLLGSDMAQIRVDAQRAIEAVAIPHMCRITRETVFDNGWLAGAFDPAWDDNDNYLRGPLFSHGKYELYDPSLDRIAGRPVAIQSMRVDAVLFPHFSLEVARQHIAPILSSEVIERLISSIGNDRPLADWLPFDLSDRDVAEAQLGRSLTAGGAVVSGYDVHFGRDTSFDWDVFDTLIDQI